MPDGSYLRSRDSPAVGAFVESLLASKATDAEPLSRRRSTLALVVALGVGCGARTDLEITLAERPLRDAGARLDAGSDVGLDARACSMRQPLTRVLSSVVLVLDRSGSMMRPLGDAGVTRDQALHDALALALPSADDAVRIGAVLYPAVRSAIDPICASASGLEVPIALDTALSIVRALELHPPAGGTPTADAIVVATEALVRPEHARGPRAILLATDGGPNCHPASMSTDFYGLSPEACIDRGTPVELCIDTERTVTVIADARDAGIPTYVVGMDVTLPILVDALDRMAIAGGRPSDGPTRFFDVERPDAIGDVLAALVEEVERCAFVPTAPAAGADVVFLDGEALAEGTSDGWTVRDGDVFVLHGAACDRALSLGARIELGPACP